MTKMNGVYYPDINRAAVLIKYKKPFIDWLIYTSKEHDDPEGELKLEDVKTEGFDSKNVYLIPAFDDNDKYEKFLRKHSSEIFTQIVGDWYTDPEMWPKNRSWKVFKEWFDYEIHTMVFDMISHKRLEYEGGV